MWCMTFSYWDFRLKSISCIVTPLVLCYTQTLCLTLFVWFGLVSKANMYNVMLCTCWFSTQIKRKYRKKNKYHNTVRSYKYHTWEKFALRDFCLPERLTTWLGLGIKTTWLGLEKKRNGRRTFSQKALKANFSHVHKYTKFFLLLNRMGRIIFLWNLI